MAKRLDWVKWYFTDWMVSVRRMGWAARGVYMEALCLQFHGERLPVTLEDWRILFPNAADSDLDQVMLRFEVREDARGKVMVNRRLEAEMNAVSLRREHGKAAAAKRWQCGSNAGALLSQCHREEKRGEEKREETSELITVNGDRPIVDLSALAEQATAKRRKRPSIAADALERIWELFPKKVGKKTAMVLLEKAIREYASEWELDELDDAAEWMREQVAQMAKRYDATDPAYIPHPATWLRQGRYMDPVEETKR